MKKTIYILLILAIAIAGCKKDKQVESTPAYKPTPYSLRIPAHFPPPVIPEANPMTVEGVALGRMLYYDPILSSNGMSCTSCHMPAHSYSKGIFMSSAGDSISVPPHINLAWNPDYLWAGGELSLEHLPIADFGPDFFNTNMDDLVSRIKSHPKYPLMFSQALGIPDVGAISHDELQRKIMYAVVQFVRTMVSDDSKFDKYLRHETTLTQSELSGYVIFMTEKGDCFHCHGAPFFTSNDLRNNGLECDPQGQDNGRSLVTGNPHDRGKFSVPTLRNIEFTAPYMHDGRFQTLEEVVEFYNSGVCSTSPNIDPIMTKPAKIYGLLLTQQEKTDLVNFLKTLTDTTFLSNPDYSSPL